MSTGLTEQDIPRVSDEPGTPGTPDKPDKQNYTKVIVAVVVVILIVLFIIIGYRAVLAGFARFAHGANSVNVQSQVTVETSGEQTSSGGIVSSAAVTDTITYPERFNVPTENNIKDRLITHDWNALITTFNVAGVITDYKQVSGLGRFIYDNGKDITMTLEWLTDSDEYVLFDWRLNSTLDGYSALYRNTSGEEMHVTIIPHLQRIDISVYDANNALKRLIVLSRF